MIVSAEAEVVSDRQCTCHSGQANSPKQLAEQLDINCDNEVCDLHGKEAVLQEVISRPYVAKFNPYATKPESHRSYSECHL